jgi:hypothetical protein
VFLDNTVRVSRSIAYGMGWGTLGENSNISSDLKSYLTDLGTDGRTILKWILKKKIVPEDVELIALAHISDRLLKDNNETLRGISSLVREPGVESLKDCVPRFQLISKSTIINTSSWGRKHNDLYQV